MAKTVMIRQANTNLNKLLNLAVSDNVYYVQSKNTRGALQQARYQQLRRIATVLLRKKGYGVTEIKHWLTLYHTRVYRYSTKAGQGRSAEFRQQSLQEAHGESNHLI